MELELPLPSDNQKDIYKRIDVERKRQDKLWGRGHDTQHDDAGWATLLRIRVRKYANDDNKIDRLVQTAAVSLPALEHHIERQ